MVRNEGRTIDEQLSALMDGELPVEQEELLLRRLEHDPELRDRFARYSVIGDLLTEPELHAGALRVADGVREQLAAEEAVGKPAKQVRGAGSGWLGAGLAAAAAAIVAINLSPAGDSGKGPQLAAVAPVEAVVQSPPRRANVAPERMTRYLVTHAQYTNAASRQFVDSHLVMPAFQRAAWQTSGSR